MTTTEKSEKRPRGSGSVFRNRNGKTLWIKYYADGKPVRESTRSADPKVAEKLLRLRLGQVLSPDFCPRKNTRVSELIQDTFADYRNQGRKTLNQAEWRWRLHLGPFFSHMKASNVTTDHLQKYVDKRRGQNAACATINRELSLLRRSFSLARKAKPPKFAGALVFPMLAENNVRTGFLELADADQVAQECSRVGLWARALFEVGRSYGWRVNELISMRCEQVDLLANVIRLLPGKTKNGRGRQVTMRPIVRALIEQLVAGKGPKDFVFTRADGRPVLSFTAAWQGICLRAGVAELYCRVCNEAVDAKRFCRHCDRRVRRDRLRYSGLLFHDLRRTGIRNLVRAGVSDKVAMTISGHVTRSVFDRYDITSQRDVDEAVHREDLWEQNERERLANMNGQPTGILVAKPVESLALPASPILPN